MLRTLQVVLLLVLSWSILTGNSLLDHYDQKGTLAFKKGDFQKAQNNWIRYSELCRRTCDQSQMERYRIIQAMLETMPLPKFEPKRVEEVVVKKKSKKKPKKIKSVWIKKDPEKEKNHSNGWFKRQERPKQVVS